MQETFLRAARPARLRPGSSSEEAWRSVCSSTSAVMPGGVRRCRAAPVEFRRQSSDHESALIAPVTGGNGAGTLTTATAGDPGPSTRSKAHRGRYRAMTGVAAVTFAGISRSAEGRWRRFLKGRTCDGPVATQALRSRYRSHCGGPGGGDPAGGDAGGVCGQAPPVDSASRFNDFIGSILVSRGARLAVCRRGPQPVMTTVADRAPLDSSGAVRNAGRHPDHLAVRSGLLVEGDASMKSAGDRGPPASTYGRWVARTGRGSARRPGVTFRDSISFSSSAKPASGSASNEDVPRARAGR